MRYPFRCRIGELPLLELLWPLVGHLVRFRSGGAYCERLGCGWHDDWYPSELV